MTALPAVPGVLRVSIIGTDASDTELGTHFYLEYTGAAPTVSQLNSLSSSIGSQYNSDLAPSAPSTFTVTTVKIVDLSTSSSAVGSATGLTYAGSASGTALADSTAFSLQYHTNLRRRGGRWHGQWRFGTQSKLQNTQTWTSAFVSSVLSNYATFITAVYAFVWSGGGTLAQVGVQYYGPPNRTVTSSTGRVRTVSTLLTTPVVWPVIGYGAYPRLGSVRRRLGKSGT